MVGRHDGIERVAKSVLLPDDGHALFDLTS